MAQNRSLRIAAAAALVPLALAGCAKPAAPGPSTPAGFTVSPAPVTRTIAPTPTASVSLPPVAPLPTGSSWVTAAAHGVKFAVPEGWTMFDLTTFNDPAVRPALEPMAKKLGLSVDEYVRQLTMQNDAIVTGPERDGFTPTISVRKEAAEWSPDVPTVADEQQLVGGISGTVTAVDPLVTAVGTGYVVRFTKPADAANVTLSCAKLALPSTRNTLFLATLETVAEADREALVTAITTTLQPA